MSQPFDLDAAVGEQVGEPFAFTWGGKGGFSVAPLQARDIEVQIQLIDAIERIESISNEPREILGVFALVVGDDLLAQMREVRPVGGAALITLIRAWIAHEGGALGKSEPSSTSSASTAPKSKPTSRSTRGRRTS
jgi:hypothetical protein